MQLALAANASN